LENTLNPLQRLGIAIGNMTTIIVGPVSHRSSDRNYLTVLYQIMPSFYAS
jgi:hypothetical protein